MGLKMQHSEDKSMATRQSGGSYTGGSILWNVCSFILITELCERMAFYTFQGTIVTFMTSELGVTGLYASQMTSLFSALVYLTPLLGGWIADEYWGRFTTIVVFISIYIVGLALCSAAANPEVLNTQLFLTGLLLFISLGAGGIKANVVTLGGDQFDETKEEQLKERTQFFNYFYWAINIGALVANAYFSNLAFNPELFSGGVVSNDMGYFVSYVIPCALLSVAFIIFLIGTPRYVRNPPAEHNRSDAIAASGDVTSNFMKEFYFALVNGGHWKGKLIFGTTIMLFIGAIMIIISFFVEENASFGLSIFAMIIILLCCSIYALVCRDLSWFGYINADPKSKEVAQRAAHTYDVKDMMYIAPYFGMLVIFWVCYNQMYTNFALQGCQMNYIVGNVIFAPAFFSLFDSLVIIILLPLVDTFLYPFIEKKLGRKLAILEKMGAGFYMMVIAMIVAGIIETSRINSGDAALDAGFPVSNATGLSESVTGVQECCVDSMTNENCFWQAEGSNCEDANFCGSETVVSTINGETLYKWESCKFNSACAQNGVILPLKNLTIWIQVVAFIFVGLGEIFTSATAYELFYAEVHPDMRSVSQGVNLWSTAYGSFAVGGFNGMFRGWIPRDLNTPSAHLDYVFYIIGVLTSIVAIIWFCVQRSHVYREDRIKEFMLTHEAGSGIGFEQDRDGIRTKSTKLMEVKPEENGSFRSTNEETQQPDKEPESIQANADGMNNEEAQQPVKKAKSTPEANVDEINVATKT